MAGELDGKVVVITGSGGAIGSVVTAKVAAAGAQLALWDLHPGPLSEVDTGAAAVLQVAADLTDEAAVDKAIAETVERYGQIDALMHIAGGFAMPGPVHEGHLSTWNKLMALNATAVYITCGKVAAHMVEAGVPGSISLIAARGGTQGGANSAAYSASKSAALRIMESMAAELREHRIRVNALSPSIVDTAANREEMGTENAEKWVKPVEIADTLIFLASEKASALTGTNVGIFKWA